MDRPRLGIVIPALNEERAIVAVVSRASEFGLPIVIDDGSADRTSAIAGAAGADVVRHETNRGYDAALNTGFARATALGLESVVTMDADGQHDPLVLPRFVAELRAGADLVVGVRDRRQRLAEHVFAWLARLAWNIEDPLCGMKGYRLAIYRRLGHFDCYRSIGTELAIFAARNGCKIVQVPVKTADRLGAPRFGRRLRANWLIFRALLLALVRRAERSVDAKQS